MRRPVPWVLLAGCVALLSVAVAAETVGPADRSLGPVEAPPTLADTGLYRDAAAREIDPGHLVFAPQYPLWTDGATKRRWMALPPGGVIDASDPDAWVFPVGTRLWKEFSFDGRPVETRFMELQPNGEWLFAAYEWSADGGEAMLAPVRGRANAYPLEDGRFHAIPAVTDCGVCHKSRAAQVLGFSALQLSPDRDPGALHADASPGEGVDLDYLLAHRLIVGLPASVRDRPPRIEARSPTERAALGYLHGNCGHCHNATGKLSDLDLVLSQAVGAPEPAALATTLDRPFQDPPPGLAPEAQVRIAPGQPDRSGLLARVASRSPALQMPPLGTALVDEAAVALLRQWISELPMTDVDVTQAMTREETE
jgi:cytochrome c553